MSTSSRVTSRTGRWVWAGRGLAVVVLAGLGIYLTRVGLETADKLASAISLLVAVAALVAPYLLPPPAGPDPAPPAGTSAGPPSAAGPEGGRSGGNDLRGAQGVQVVQDHGTGTQTNTFPGS